MDFSARCGASWNAEADGLTPREIDHRRHKAAVRSDPVANRRRIHQEHKPRAIGVTGGVEAEIGVRLDASARVRQRQRAGGHADAPDFLGAFIHVFAKVVRDNAAEIVVDDNPLHGCDNTGPNDGAE